MTTYKPTFQFLKTIFSNEDEEDVLSTAESMDIVKVTPKTEKNVEKLTTVADEERTEKYTSPGDIDLGTGTPDPTVDDLLNTHTEPTTARVENISKVDRYSFMDYLFGVTSEGEHENEHAKNETQTTAFDIEITTEVKPKMITTESSYIPEEITEAGEATDNVELETTSKATETPKVEETTKSVFMNVNAISTAMSTEVSHETEICFRGKCIKTSKDIL